MQAAGPPVTCGQGLGKVFPDSWSPIQGTEIKSEVIFAKVVRRQSYLEQRDKGTMGLMSQGPNDMCFVLPFVGFKRRRGWLL